MKNFTLISFALFAFAASASNGLGKMMGKDFFTPLDTLSIQQSLPLEQSDPQTGFYTASQVVITIEEGTTTNINALAQNDEKAASVVKNKVAFYIAPATAFFITENTSTNLRAVQPKITKQQLPQATAQKKSGKAGPEKVKTFQFTEEKSPKKIFEMGLASAGIPAPVLKDNKTKNTAAAVSPGRVAALYKKRKSTCSKHFFRLDFKAFSNFTAYALFSRPPTAA